MKTSMLKPLFAAVMGMVAPTLSVIASETSDPVPVADRSLFFDIFASGQEKNGALTRRGLTRQICAEVFVFLAQTL